MGFYRIFAITLVCVVALGYAQGDNACDEYIEASKVALGGPEAPQCYQDNKEKFANWDTIAEDFDNLKGCIGETSAILEGKGVVPSEDCMSMIVAAMELGN